MDEAATVDAGNGMPRSPYLITSIATTGSTSLAQNNVQEEWVVVASNGACASAGADAGRQGCPQKIITGTTFPWESWNTHYNAGYRITSMAASNTTGWVLVLHQNSGIGLQKVINHHDTYPSTALFEQGWTISSMSGNWEGWHVVHSQPSRFGPPCLKICANEGVLNEDTCTCTCKFPWFGDSDKGKKIGVGCQERPEPCVLSEFGEYDTKCPVACDGDYKRRRRTILQEPSVASAEDGPAYDGASCAVVNCQLNRAAFVDRKNTDALSKEEETFTFKHFVSLGHAGEDAKDWYNTNDLSMLYKHNQVGVWFFDYLEYLDCHSNSTSVGYDAWTPGELLPNIKYKSNDQVWGEKQTCELYPGASKHEEVAQCLTHTAENMRATDQLCRESKSNQQVEVNRALCYLDYKQIDQCNREVCNGAPRPRITVYASEEYQFRGGRGVDYVDSVGDLGSYTASGQFVVKRAPIDHYVAPEVLTALVDGEDGEAADGADEVDTSTPGDGEPDPKTTSGTGPKVDRFTRNTLFMIQKPEDTIILDATSSFDLAVPIEEELGYEHCALVLQCYRTPASEACRTGLAGLALGGNNGTAVPNTALLKQWFTGDSIPEAERLTDKKLTDQMTSRGLKISGTWINMIETLSMTRELPLGPDWDVTWSIDGYENSQEMLKGISGLSSSGEYFNENWNKGREPNVNVVMSDDEIQDHLGDLWLKNLGRAQYANQLKNDGSTTLTPKMYGIQLARKLLRKVSFTKTCNMDMTDDELKNCQEKDAQLGLWNIQLSIQDGEQTDGDTKIPFTAANCEPPDLNIEWLGQYDDKPGRTGLPLVNPSDKVKISGAVWYFGMGDVQRESTPTTLKLWQNNKDALRLTWISVNAENDAWLSSLQDGPQTVAKYSDDETVAVSAQWNGTKLIQDYSVLENVEGLDMTNLIVGKWMLEPTPPGILQYSQYKFKLGVTDKCSESRPEVFREFLVVVNSPPYNGYMTLGKVDPEGTGLINYDDRFGTALNDTFEVNMHEWLDTDLPLSYAYKYVLDDGTGYQTQFGKPCDIEDKMEDTMCNEVPVSSAGFANDTNCTLSLPAGGLVVVGYVQDSYGAKTRWLYLNQSMELEHLSNLTMWEPAFNGTDAKAAALQGAADNLVASSEGGTDDDAINGVNAVVGMLNDANASIVSCCTGHAFVDDDEESESFGEEIGCTLTTDKAGVPCDFGHDPLCAVIECRCAEDEDGELLWEGDFCERPSGQKLKEKQATKTAIVEALKSVNFSDPNASSVAEGGGKALAQGKGGRVCVGG